jgi:predicted DNA-binding protein YlxM (UPF0122 family)
MTELKLRSQDPDSIKTIIKSALSERLEAIEQAIKETEKHLQEFENKYQLSTVEILKRFNNDELQHSFDFDDWLGEAWLWETLKRKQEIIKETEFVN